MLDCQGPRTYMYEAGRRLIRRLSGRWTCCWKTGMTAGTLLCLVCCQSIPLVSCSILGSVLSLQEVVLRRSPSTFSILCYSCGSCPFPDAPQCHLSNKVFFLSSKWFYTIVIPFCASNGSASIIHSYNVSSLFPFRCCHVFHNVCHAGPLLNNGVSDSVFYFDI